MYRVLYVSDHQGGISPQLSSEIHQQAVANNQHIGVTGMLAIVDQHFFQILEGERARVSDLLEKIKTDSRHCNVRIITEGDVDSREFAQWSMGFLPCKYDDQLQSANQILSKFARYEHYHAQHGESIFLLLKSLVWR